MSVHQIPTVKETFEPEIAGFIGKTYEILCNPDYSKIIFWSPSGQEFVIKDINKFEDLVLPRYFRHSKINSFVRQLNMYGFHKSRKDTAKSIFSHPCFQRQRDELLSLIKRKVKRAEKGIKTPTKKGVGISEVSLQTKIQTQEKKQKQNVQQHPEEAFDHKIRFDSNLNLNLPLSINSMGESVAGEELMNKNQEPEISIQICIKKEQNEQELVKFFNPAVFMNSFKE